jgi:type II secretory ATPase GspE/PulE/Tfp pilus assembly ATPase PilB-like protein
MASPLGDRIDSKPSNSVHELVLSKFQGDLAERLNVQQMFILIDGVLPFEACLYYQVLPLFIEGSRLNLGMVSPQDTSAADYVRRIVSYHHYSLIPRQISSDALQGALSAYLNYSGKQQATAIRQPLPNGDRPKHPVTKPKSDRPQASKPLLQNLQPTLVVDSPDMLGTSELHLNKSQTPANPSSPASSPTSTPETFPTLELKDEDSLPNSLVPPTSQKAPVKSQEPDLKAYPSKVAPSFEADLEASPSKADTPSEAHGPFNLSSSVVASPAAPPLVQHLPELDIDTSYVSISIEAMATLPPSELIKALMARVLHSGIGRLYFERQLHQGRVLWSQDGVLQSIVENLSTDVFHGLLNELKHMANLSFIPSQKSKQVEIERLYQQTRVLLRLKFMPSEYGEEATLQVLRGAALRFYQQQQLANLERDALTIAKQLQTKISEIRDRARSDSGLSGAKLDVLPALSQLLKHIEEQLGSLQTYGE